MRFSATTLFSVPFFTTSRSLPATADASAPQVRHDNPRYNSATGLFEARVDVTRNGATFRYPVQVRAAFDADPVWLSQALIRRALELSDTPRLH